MPDTPRAFSQPGFSESPESPKSYDVVVIGGGPAGASAAKVLAEAGADVLVLERRTFPRHKLCAGLLTWKTMDAIERVFGETPERLLKTGAVNHASDRYRVRHKGRILLEGKMFHPFHFARRKDLDALLLDRAEQAGARVVCGDKVVRADPLTGEVETGSGKRVAAGHIIGADGALGVTRQAFPILGRAWRAELGTGLEIFLDRNGPHLSGAAHEDLTADFPTVYSGFIHAGYSWTFPHKNHVVVGVGGLNRGGVSRFRPSFMEFIRFLGLPESLGAGVRAHPLPFGNFLRRPAHGRALLAGDAAGFVETLFGEGIYYAVRTGELAGQASAIALRTGAAPAVPYLSELRRDVFPEFIYSRRLRKALFRGMRLGAPPVSLFLQAGGGRLIEMVHGVRSYKWLRRRTAAAPVHTP